MKWIVGVDEAGRGPLAGPVSVGVVKVAEGYDVLAAFPGLNDSKKLSEKKREALFALLQEAIREGSVHCSVYLTSAKAIDAKGIAVCIRESVHKGIQKILPLPEEGKVYLDGSLSAPKEYVQETIIGGDALVPAIMLASVAAKVTRDRYMKKIAPDYPYYSFDVHKGYGTKAHYAALKAHGLSQEHRKTFIHL